MSLITSCPACGTMFRVVPDQLKISEGWVRCGHCAEVFDATAHLADEPASVPAPPEPPEPPFNPAATDPGVNAWLTTSAATLTAPAPLPLRRADPEPEPEPEPEPGPDSQSLEPTPLDEPFVFRRSDLVHPDAVPSVLPPRPDSRFPAQDDEEEPAPAELGDMSFVRQARRRAAWRRPLVRVFLSLLVLALAAALLLQVAWQERDRLAAAQPALRPALELMCEQLACRLGPPRQIESLVIETSAFNRLRNDAYRLSFTVRNNAPVTVAAPAMELTLTDPQDQPLMRKVLTPAELGARDNVIAAGAEWSGAVGIVLSAAGGPRVAGYRLLAFYP